MKCQFIMAQNEKLIQDLASREYMRLAAEIKALVFDDSWSEDEKSTIRRYLHKLQDETQMLRNINCKNMMP